MQHARYKCPSATLRCTIKRRSSSMYEASGCASVTLASSAFSVPVAVISCSCKPALLCSDGCGAAAVHSVCRRSCGQWSVNAQMTKGVRPTASSATATLTRASALARCARACVRAEAAYSGGSMQHATRDGRMQHATCNMQHATDDIHTPAIPCVADDARSVPCGELQRDGCGAAELCRCATGVAHGRHYPPPPPPPPPPPAHTHTHTEKKLSPNNAAASAAHWPKSDLSGKRPTHASIR